MPRARINGWENALNVVIEKHAALPFEWGVSDCFMLPLDGVVACLGRDPWPNLHDYDSQLGAMRRLTEQGCATLADLYAAKFQEIPPTMAGRGDLAVVESDGVLCGALFLGVQLAGKAPDHVGVLYMPRARALRAFRVA